MLVNDYSGIAHLDELDEIASNSISSKDFYTKYISHRKPVKFTDHLPDKQWKASASKWTNSYLKSKSNPNSLIKVEYRTEQEYRFGLGKEKLMTFEEFLDKIDTGDEGWYLTTQEFEFDPEGQPYIMSPPTSFLQSDFPIVPDLFATLIPANINLWYGQSKTYSTSGLHHDFHDNLYVVLKGEKKITLISPAYTEQLYTAGKVAKVHPNGRINYEGQLTHADGRDLKADKAWEASLALKEAALRLKDDEEDDSAEDEIDRALEAVLDAELEADDYCDDEEDEDGEWEDIEDDDDENKDDKDDESEEESKQNDELPGRRKRSFSVVDDDASESGKQQQKSKPRQLPKNFSQIDTSLPEDILKVSFPQYLEAKKHAITVTIKAGEMLYIPCGWFHEVQSLGNGGHVALNYWFHPPDGKQYDHPYENDFWKQTFENRKKFPSKPVL